MAYPSFAVSDLSAFSGRPADSYTADGFAPQAIFQATVLFRTMSGLTDWPTDPNDAQLAQLGLLAMADHFWLSRKYAPIEASPLQSESLGSYHYSKAMSGGRGMRGESRGGAGMGKPHRSTGVAWFDLALEHLAVYDGDSVQSGSIGMFEDDLARICDVDGREWLVNPADLLRNVPQTSGGVLSSDSGSTTIRF